MLLLFLCLLPLAASQGERDLIVNLPGLTFKPNFKSYSGYLNANAQNTSRMHYFLTESKSNPDTDPLLLWFNGGPGCSSLGGMFEELGPFYINYDGNTLFENAYSWNAKANVLALESPVGVGFSYDRSQNNYTNADDRQSALQNYLALKDFFVRVQPKYANRTFFLSGESYGGIYIPMLSQLIMQGINDGSFPNTKFQGAAIGNGFMHVQYLYNSLVIWSAYHGRISQDDWDMAKNVCRTGVETHSDRYNYQQFMVSTNGMDWFADVNSSDPTRKACANLIAPLITDYPAGPNIDFDQYNYYQDCYVLGNQSATGNKRAFGTYQTMTRNTASLFNYDSTDTQWGYTCWNGGPVSKYLNNRAVQAALHIDVEWQNQDNGTFRWRDCNDPMYDLYKITFNTTNTFFNDVIQNSKSDFRFLVYNGDVDTVCNYLGDSWFIRDVARDNGLISSSRQPWLFGSQLAGFNQHYEGTNKQGKNIGIDVLTVKGAGHFVPGDRPGPSRQMITNFMFPAKPTGPIDYSSSSVIANTPSLSPLLQTNRASVPVVAVSFLFALLRLA